MSGVDRLGFGCVAHAGLASPRQARDLLEGVLDLGIRHFDTAPVYGRGYSERLLPGAFGLLPPDRSWSSRGQDHRGRGEC